MKTSDFWQIQLSFLRVSVFVMVVMYIKILVHILCPPHPQLLPTPLHPVIIIQILLPIS